MDIVDKGETTPPPAFDNIAILFTVINSRNINEILASIFNIALVLQYRFISSLVNENEQEDNYITSATIALAGETYGDYDSEREAENTAVYLYRQMRKRIGRKWTTMNIKRRN